jgi:hypothetical protein
MVTLRAARRAMSAAAAAPKRIATPPFALKATQGYINGRWVAAASGRTLPVVNPATGDTLATVPDMGQADTLAAVAAASAAFPKWAATLPAHRGAILRKLNDLLLAHAPALATTLTSECGKPWAEAQGEIAYSASFAEWFGEEAKRSYGDIIPPPRADRRILALKQPLGVAVSSGWGVGGEGGGGGLGRGAGCDVRVARALSTWPQQRCVCGRCTEHVTAAAMRVRQVH